MNPCLALVLLAIAVWLLLIIVSPMLARGIAARLIAHAAGMDAYRVIRSQHMWLERERLGVGADSKGGRPD